MRKTVLLAETSDATRSIAETILRQNGFEVIAVSDSASAVEVAANTRPDLILVGAELVHQKQPVYEIVRRSASGERPILVFAGPGQAVDGVGTGQVIPRPFNPHDFLEKVLRVIGSQPQGAADDGQRPFVSGDDEQLDTALGLGTTGVIKVTESEVLNQTRGIASQARPAVEDRDNVEFNAAARHDDELDRTGRIESIIISDDQTDIRRPETTKTKRPATPPTDTGGLDIMGDQYGLTDPGAFRQQQSEQALTHDYHWFVNEMQKDSGPHPTEPQPKDRPAAQPVDELVFTDPSSTLEVFNPKDYLDKEKKKTESAGVEKFIDEFKREVEKFQTEEPESLTLHQESANKPDEPKWEELVENITPERVNLFTRQLSADLAERIAEKIVAKLDPDKLANLLKVEIMDHLRTKRGR